MHMLEIKSVPMKYQLDIEPARLEYQQNLIPTADVNVTPSELKINTEPTQLRLDTYEARRSLGFAKIEDLVSKAAERGYEAIQRKTRSAVEMGKQMSNIEDGATISQIIGQKMLDQKEMYTAFLPSGGADVSWLPGQTKMEYAPSELSYDWNIKPNQFNYIPGDVRIKILEYAHIEVKYLGGPMYVPPSAAPDYEEPSS